MTISELEKLIADLEVQLRALKSHKAYLSRLVIGSRVWAKDDLNKTGEVVGWDDDLLMNLIMWDKDKYGLKEACEPHEYELIKNPTTDELRLLRTIKELDESIAIEKSLDSMHRKEA